MTEISAADGLAQLSFRVQASLERRAGEHDLSITQTRLLGILRDRTPTLSELASTLGLDKSSVSGLVDRAERRALVRRIPSSTDGRSIRVEMTEAGHALAHGFEKQFDSDIARLLAPLAADDRSSLARLISRLLESDEESSPL